MVEHRDQSNVAFLSGAELRFGREPGGELDVELAVTTACELLIRVADDVVWRLKVEPAIAAYISGRLALAAGVTIGDDFAAAVREVAGE